MAGSGYGRKAEWFGYSPLWPTISYRRKGWALISGLCGLEKTWVAVVFFFFNLFILIYLFLSVLGLCCCTRAFSSCGEWGLLFFEVHRLLFAVASLVAEHRL